MIESKNKKCSDLPQSFPPPPPHNYSDTPLLNFLCRFYKRKLLMKKKLRKNSARDAKIKLGYLRRTINHTK